MNEEIWVAMAFLLGFVTGLSCAARIIRISVELMEKFGR